MLTVKKLHDDLDCWIRIGIGDDIIKLPEQRKEYQHLIKSNIEHFKKKCGDLDMNLLPELVLTDLKNEINKPWPLRRTFWVLLRLNVSRAIQRFFRIKLV